MGRTRGKKGAGDGASHAPAAAHGRNGRALEQAAPGRRPASQRAERAGPDGADDPGVVYESAGQLYSVYAVTALSVLCAGLALATGWYVGNHFGLSPADGGVLRPLWQRVAFGSALASVGCAFAGGMLLYLRLYIARLRIVERDGEGRTVTLEAAMAFPGLRVPLSEAELMGTGDHAGRSSHFRGVSVNAPWTSLRLRGRRLPLILDAQGRWLRPSDGPLMTALGAPLAGTFRELQRLEERASKGRSR